MLFLGEFPIHNDVFELSGVKVDPKWLENWVIRDFSPLDRVSLYYHSRATL